MLMGIENEALFKNLVKTFIKEKQHPKCMRHHPEGYHWIWALSVVIIVAIIGFGYMDYQQSKQVEALSNALAQAVADYTGKVADLNAEMVQSNEMVQQLITNVQQENKKNVDALSALIDKVEKQSNIQLTEIKGELKNIDIKSNDFSAIVDDVLPSVVSVFAGSGQGSGVFFKENGYIVTNEHVISSSSSLNVLTYDGKRLSAQLIGIESRSDLAVLKVNSSAYPALDFGDSSELKVGQRVIALGNPGGLDFSVTEGIISSTQREAANGLSYIQTDVPLNPGNSGGPLVNINKEIIGINNFKIGGFESLGFAIPSNTVKEVTDEIISRFG